MKTLGLSILGYNRKVNQLQDKIRNLQKHIVACSDTVGFQARRIEQLKTAAEKAINELVEAEEFHSAACMNWVACEHSQHQCGLCDLREALRNEDTEAQSS